jgi:hypothetical protein
MQPQQPTYPPGQAPIPQNTGQYDFIVNTGNHRSGGLLSANTPMKTRIVVVAGGGVALLVLALLFFALLSNTGNNNNDALIAVAQRQAELVRISQQPVTQADQQATQNFAATTYTSLMSDEQVILHVLALHNAKVSSSQLAARQNPQTDSQLASAKGSGTYDQTYLSIAQSQLNAYIQALKTAYTGAPTLGEKQDLKDAYDQAQLLVTMSSQQ